MERSSQKKAKTNEVHINQLSTLKRVSDLFPKGLTTETTVNNLPKDVTKLINDSPVTKNIPNLVESSLPAIPQNSISTEVDQQNSKLEDLSKQQVQTKLFKQIKPFNIVTLVLILGWVVTIILLNVL
jgi:hypothetical protein